MSRSGVKKVKVLIQKKKINHYNMDDCNAELARLEKLNDGGSIYRQHILERKRDLA